MISLRLLGLSCLIVSLLIAPARGADERGLPPMEELEEMLEQKKYQPLLQTISRVLALKGEKAKAYDRGKVLLLKGEAHLQMKMGTQAVGAFTDAAKEATDSKDVATGRANAMLIKRSDQFKYRPQTGGHAKVAAHDILADRKAAFEALREDELAAVTPKLRFAQGAKTLSAIIEVVKATEGFRALEMVTTGETAETRKLLGGLAEQAAKLMNDEIYQMESRVAEIERAANEIVPVRDTLPGGQMISSHRRQGITDRDQKELRGVISTCQRILPVSQELSDVFGAENGEFAGAAGGAERLAEHARKVATTDYTGMAGRLGRDQSERDQAERERRR